MRARHPVCALDLFDDGRHWPLCAATARRCSRAPARGRDSIGRTCCYGLPGCVHHHDASDWSYGAGFEDDTETLALLARGRELLAIRRAGRASEGSGRILRPAGRLGIAHPPTVLARPERRPRLAVQAARRDRGLSRGRRLVGGLPFGRADGYFQRRAAAVGTCRCCFWPMAGAPR